MRGTIATRMHESLQTMAQLTLGMEVDADRLVALREQLREDWSGDADRRLPSYTDFVLRAVATALGEHPLLNARVTAQAVELEPEVHVGLAVALDHGLVVPVIRFTDQLSLADIAVESARLSAAARDGRLSMDDLAGGTFSVTTLGSYDVDFFTPVINPPNVGILGVGRLRDGVALGRRHPSPQPPADPVAHVRPSGRRRRPRRRLPGHRAGSAATSDPPAHLTCSGRRRPADQLRRAGRRPECAERRRPGPGQRTAEPAGGRAVTGSAPARKAVRQGSRAPVCSAAPA